MQPINAANNANGTNVQEAFGVGMLKNDLDTQKNNVSQLLKALPAVKDTTVGQNVDLYA